MRKSTLISGIILTAVVFIGVVLRLFHLPGSNPFIIFGIALLMVYFLPSLLIYRLKNDSTAFEKGTTIFGCIVAWLFLLPGLLFSIQRWPGGVFLIFLGIPGGLIFLVLYFLAKNKAQKPVSPFEPFTLIVLSLFIILFTGRFFVRQATAENLEQDMADYEIALTERSLANDAMQVSYNKVSNDTTDTLSIRSAQHLYSETQAVLQYINEMRGEVVAECIGAPPSVGDTFSVRLIERPGDYDTPTNYFIGPDPANVTGKSKELNAALYKYLNKNYSRDQIKGNEPADIYDKEQNRMISWGWATFYHKNIIQDLTTLLKIQTSILQLEKKAFEEKNFISK